MPEKFVEAKVTGLDELRERLVHEEPKRARSILRKAIRAGSQLFLQSVIREAPHETGFLAEHFKIRTSIRGDNANAYVVPDSKAIYPEQAKTPGAKKPRARDVAEVARFQEFGTTHQPANPFMTRGFEIARSSVLDKVIQTLKDLLR